MIKLLIIVVSVLLFAVVFLPLVADVPPLNSLGLVASKYVSDGPNELGGSNIVTSIVVIYRGLDTLGEVTVLFLATAGIGFILRKKKSGLSDSARPSSEILQTASSFLFPLLAMFGVYVFIHGHLTPGGGFQGGVIIASGVLLLMLSDVSIKLNHLVLDSVESLSGAFYVSIGLLGLFLAAGFLDSRFLPLGRYGALFSAGAIPLIYSFIGLKVGSELTGILDNMTTGNEQ